MKNKNTIVRVRGGRAGRHREDNRKALDQFNQRRDQQAGTQPSGRYVRGARVK